MLPRSSARARAASALARGATSAAIAARDAALTRERALAEQVAQLSAALDAAKLENARLGAAEAARELDAADARAREIARSEETRERQDAKDDLNARLAARKAKKAPQGDPESA